MGRISFTALSDDIIQLLTLRSRAQTPNVIGSIAAARVAVAECERASQKDERESECVGEYVCCWGEGRVSEKKNGRSERAEMLHVLLIDFRAHGRAARHGLDATERWLRLDCKRQSRVWMMRVRV